MVIATTSPRNVFAMHFGQAIFSRRISERDKAIAVRNNIGFILFSTNFPYTE